MTNMDKLYEAVEARGPVCVGLDTDFSYLPADFVDSTLTKGNGGVVNSSRGILLAYKKQPGVAFDEAAYNECVNMKEAIAHACSLL